VKDSSSLFLRAGNFAVHNWRKLANRGNAFPRYAFHAGPDGNLPWTRGWIINKQLFGRCGFDYPRMGRSTIEDIIDGRSSFR